MFDCIAAAAFEMARAAVFAVGDANTLGNSEKVNAFQWVTGYAFCVSAGVVMAGQTVDIFLDSEIVVFVFPSITNVAFGAFGPVALNADAEVVDLVLFADSHRLVASGQLHKERESTRT